MTKLETRDIQKLAKKAGVNKPVMSVRVVGGRVELHLLGGDVVSLDNNASDNDRPILPTAQATTGQESTSLTPPNPLKDLTKSQLQHVASQLKLIGYTRLNKQELIDLLNDRFTDAQLAEAIRS